MSFITRTHRMVASLTAYVLVVPILAMGSANAVEPAEVAAASGSFFDVGSDNQFFDEISWLAAEGISTGYTDGSFRPLQPVNRDAMAAFMYRLAGEPAYTPPASSPFRDVTTRTQFYKEISWLASKKISTGYPDETYRPVQPVNRDAMAAFMYRLAGSPTYTAPATARFTDVGTGVQFYKEISWLASKKISEGWPDNTYRPVQPVNRDAMAAFMYRYAGSPAPIQSAPPTLSKQRSDLQVIIAAAQQEYVNSRPFISSLPRPNGVVVQDAIALGTGELQKVAVAVREADTQAKIDQVAPRVRDERLRAATVKTSAAQLKRVVELRITQQDIARKLLADRGAARITEANYQAGKSRAAGFTTQLAADAANQLSVIGKVVQPKPMLATGWLDELQGGTKPIPSAPGWVGFAGGCALPYADPKFAPRLPAAGPGVATNNNLVARAKVTGETDATVGPIHRQMIREASRQAATSLTVEQLWRGYPERVARLGYGWLEAGDVPARDSLRSDAKKILAAGPESMNTLTASHLLLAAATGSDWSSATGMEETVLIRWLGPITCLHEDRENFVDAASNIAAIHNSATFAAAAVFLEKQPLLSAALARESLVSIQPALKLILTDGGTQEGPGYWTYQSRALASLYSTLPNVYSTLPVAMPPLAKTSGYALNSTALDGVPTAFGDAEPNKLIPLMPAWDAYSRGDRAVAAWVEKELIEKPDAYLMWWRVQPGALPAKKSSVYPLTGLAALHLPAGTAVLKGGDNAASHGHLDLGSLAFYRKGVQWSIDPGGELGSPAGYYSAGTRWNFWKTSTSAHSTLSVAGANQPLTAKAATTMQSPTSASVNLTQALAGSNSAKRSIEHTQTGMTVRDTVTSAAGIPLTWQWVTDAAVTVDASSNVAVLSKNGKQVTIQLGGVPGGSKLSVVQAPETSNTGATLRIVRLVMPKVTSLNLTAIVK
ncbi:S-layer homology domain-containing protein [Arthrobacter sp. Sr33]